jgi:hypothetical protein
MGGESGISEGLSWGDVDEGKLALTRDIACMRERGGRERGSTSERLCTVSWFIEFDVTLALTGECLCSAQQQPRIGKQCGFEEKQRVPPSPRSLRAIAFLKAN